MGKPKFPRKKYDTPLHPWKEERIKSEREFMRKYGLKNHREVWKAKTALKKYRGQARELLAKIGGTDPQVKKESDQLLLHLTRMDVLPAGSTLDDVLALDTESILSRRLQTLVYHRGLSNTVDQARQLISHGHIAINGKKITIPGYLVTKNEENNIGYVAASPLMTVSHPARPKTDVYRTAAADEQKKETATAEKKEVSISKAPEKIIKKEELVPSEEKEEKPSGSDSEDIKQTKESDEKET